MSKESANVVHRVSNVPKQRYEVPLHLLCLFSDHMSTT
jgi:hypothetical protein